ncbi:SBBP repeat-containing protein [Bacteroidota bacterium]
MKKKLTFFLILLFIGGAGITKLNGQSIAAETALNKADNTFFIENQGQWPEEVLYLTRIGGLDAWITKEGVVYDFYKIKEVEEVGQSNIQFLEETDPGIEKQKGMQRYGQVVKLQLQKSKTPLLKPVQKQDGYYNYFLGNDERKWASHVALYKEIKLENVYEDIDLKYYFDQGYLRYDYIVKPGGDPNEIKFELVGDDGHSIKPSGELVFDSRFGEIAQKELTLYQVVDGLKKKVSGEFVFDQKDNSFGFKIKNYDPSKELIIDPLVYSTFLGGSSSEKANGIAVDASGQVYVTGQTSSSDFPTTVGAYDHSNGYLDIFVTKFNSSGSGLIYSTYLGGSKHDYGNGIAIDSDNQAHITGYTYSSDFPTTPGAYDQSFNSFDSYAIDVFVTKLNSSGSGLKYSTFIGGQKGDVANGIAVDASGLAYITGNTMKGPNPLRDYPTTTGAYDESHNGDWDVFVTKFNSSGSRLIYSTFLGGESGGESGLGIAVDAFDQAYITGYTKTLDFPTTPRAYDKSFNGLVDVFVTKLNSSGSKLIYSTFLGGNHHDQGYGIAVDASGQAYVTGMAASSDFPTTPGAYDTLPDAPHTDAFITKLNSIGSELIYSTFLGGSNQDQGYGIAVDASGQAYVTGYTYSSDFPTTPGAYDQSHNGGYSDVSVTKLNSSGSGLIYSTFLGGSGSDWGNGIAVDASGQAYVTGYTLSSDYPTTPGAWDTEHSGITGYDCFVTKISLPHPCEGPQIICPADVRIECDESTDPANTGMVLYIGGCGEVTITFSDATTTPATPEDYYTITRTWTATDENGNTSICDQTITVNPCSCKTEDNTDPTLIVVSDPITIWPPNHKYEAIDVGQLLVSVTDNCVNLFVSDVYITSVTSDEEEDAPGNDDGSSLDDIVISLACDIVNLRRERNKKGNGRVYTINLAVDDGNGNTGTAVCQVNVPISKYEAAIEDDVAYGEECGGSESSAVAFTEYDIQLTNYPNPFNGNTTITFTLIETDNTTLKVYDTFGKEVAILFDGMAESGQQYTLNFSSGNLSEGIYLYRLQSGNNVSVVKKMILIK